MPSTKTPSDPETGIFRGPKTLSVMPTWTCTAACNDCGTLSSPQNRTQLPLEAMLAGIEQAADLGFGNVVFTGGEATLRWKDLLKAITHARLHGFPTRLVTNAYWATTPEQAGSRLDQLLDAGLTEINYSTGDEHIRFIPLERVINATVAAVERDLRVHIMVELREQRTITKADVIEHPRIRALTQIHRDKLFTSESPWMPLDPDEVGTYPEGATATADNIGMKTGCDSVLQTYVMEADGSIGACCGIGSRTIPELQVGESTGDDFLKGAIEEAENDFLKLWIRYKGPEKILAWASAKNPEIEWKGKYAHRCQACLRLYKDPAVGKVMREHHHEMYADVLQSAYLDEVYTPRNLGEVIGAKLDRQSEPADSA